jgi:hypothetical protein
MTVDSYVIAIVVSVCVIAALALIAAWGISCTVEYFIDYAKEGKDHGRRRRA